MSSIFTKIINREIPAYIIAENVHNIAFLDINPLKIGHTLVVPKLETDYIFDLPENEYNKLFLFAKTIAKAIKKSFPCERIGLSIIGLEVPHAHIHLVPINQIGDLNFSQSSLSLSQDKLKEIVNKIKQNL